MAKGEFPDSTPEALEELEEEDCLHFLVGEIAPGQKQQQLWGRRHGEAFPASSQIEGCDGTNTATAFCGLVSQYVNAAFDHKTPLPVTTRPLKLQNVTHNSMHVIFLDTAVIQS